MKLFERVEDKIDFDIERKTYRGCLSEIHLADLHFGAINPKDQYEILKREVIDELYKISIIDIIFINGDIFDRKYSTDSEPIYYASLFMADLRLAAIEKNATVILLSGTEFHDAGQLNIFYHYLEDPLFDIRIVENIRFEYVKGAKILCIPELYGIPEEVYEKYLYEYGPYDQCVMHGTIEGAVYGNTINKRGRLFHIDDFNNCRGPIVSGHVHTPGCFNVDFYYTGTPIRYQFGQEEEKGFMLIYYNLDTHDYFPYLIPVKSFRYDTIDINELTTQDPKDIIAYVNKLKEEDGIDYLRITYNDNFPTEDITIIKEYYKNNGRIRMKLNESKKEQVATQNNTLDKYKQYSYLFDESLTPYDKLAIYINSKENCEYISGDEIKKIVEEEI